MICMAQDGLGRHQKFEILFGFPTWVARTLNFVGVLTEIWITSRKSWLEAGASQAVSCIELGKWTPCVAKLAFVKIFKCLDLIVMKQLNAMKEKLTAILNVIWKIGFIVFSSDCGLSISTMVDLKFPVSSYSLISHIVSDC